MDVLISASSRRINLDAATVPVEVLADADIHEQ